MPEQVTFPWWNESRRKNPRVACDYFTLLSAYAAVQNRWQARMAAERRAEAEIARLQEQSV